jgi:transposase-like protein
MFNAEKLNKMLDTEEKALSFLQDVGLLHRERFCEQGHAMKLLISTRDQRWRCSKVSCKKQKQLKSGTWLEGCHLSYRKACMFIYYWAHEQTTIKFSMHELGIGSETTIVDWNNYLREVCAMKLVEEPVCIGGEGFHVEIDESLFVRREYNVGRAVLQQWVFGGTCRETGECFLYAVEDRSAKTLLPIIELAIKRGTTIISDAWRAYMSIKDIPNRDYKHISVNHSKNFVDPATGACTNSVESLWGKAKARNKKHWGTHRSMIDSYLSEFIWRRRLGGKDPFLSILEDIVKINPLA